LESFVIIPRSPIFLELCSRFIAHCHYLLRSERSIVKIIEALRCLPVWAWCRTHCLPRLLALLARLKKLYPYLPIVSNLASFRVKCCVHLHRQAVLCLYDFAYVLRQILCLSVFHVCASSRYNVIYLSHSLLSFLGFWLSN